MNAVSSDWTRSGKAWVFPNDYVNTDAIMPRAGFELPAEQQRELVLATIRPGWSRLVKAGDILIAGRAFGTGSSRPASMYISQLGIAAIVAESVGDIFFRNCVGYAVPVLECPGVLDLVSEGDEVAVNIELGTFLNHTTGARAVGAPMPNMLLETIAAGGIQALLRRDGYV